VSSGLLSDTTSAQQFIQADAASRRGLIQALALMKRIIATACGALVLASAAAGMDQTILYDWRPSHIVEVDLDRNGQIDSAQLGIAPDNVGLRVTVNSNLLPIIDIPIDGSRQFGICPGSEPSISLVAQSDAPLNALGENPQGYEVCEDCIEIVVSGGECDPLHFYWDTTTNQLTWWRA
jgi:hypothetical protein